MVLDIVAIVTPAPGKEARVEEILKDLTAKVEQHEPDVAKYMAYKTQNAEGATEYLFVERYVPPVPLYLKPSTHTSSLINMFCLPTYRYKDESALTAHSGSDYFQAAGKKFGDEGLLSKGLTVYKMQPLSGFDSR